jgi:hypothetical protein
MPFVSHNIPQNYFIAPNWHNIRCLFIQNMLCNVLVGCFGGGGGGEVGERERFLRIKNVSSIYITNEIWQDFTNILIRVSERSVLETSTCFKPNEGGEFIYEDFQIGSIH